MSQKLSSYNTYDINAIIYENLFILSNTYSINKSNIKYIYEQIQHINKNSKIIKSTNTNNQELHIYYKILKNL